MIWRPDQNCKHLAPVPVTGFGAVAAFLFQCLYAEGCVCGIPAGLLAICWPVTSFHSEVCYAHVNLGKSKCRMDDKTARCTHPFSLEPFLMVYFS